MTVGDLDRVTSEHAVSFSPAAKCIPRDNTGYNCAVIIRSHEFRRSIDVEARPDKLGNVGIPQLMQR